MIHAYNNYFELNISLSMYYNYIHAYNYFELNISCLFICIISGEYSSENNGMNSKICEYVL